jgi:hypothetical protein
MAVCDYLVNKENDPEHKRISNYRTLMKENIVFLLKIDQDILSTNSTLYKAGHIIY